MVVTEIWQDPPSETQAGDQFLCWGTGGHGLFRISQTLSQDLIGFYITHKKTHTTK